MLGSLSIWEILIIVLIIALLFGGKKLPELGRGLGQGIKNFKNSLKGEEKAEKKDDDRNASAD
jgi:sec-independent protein translocase protein TatA